MVIQFFIQYRTSYGQSLHLNLRNSKNDSPVTKIPLQYFNDTYWTGIIDSSVTDLKSKFWYAVELNQNDWEAGTEIIPFKKFEGSKKKEYHIYEQIIQQDDLHVVFDSKAFGILLKPVKKIKYKKAESKNATHEFHVAAPHMNDRYVLAISGGGDQFNNWDKSKPVLLDKKKKYWSGSVNLSKEDFPLEYKLALYDLETNSIVHFEEGDNRILPASSHKDVYTVLSLNAPFSNFQWKGAGVNIPVSSLRSEKSWGVGDFTDLHLLTDWAEASGIRMVQLLPVNDTTATHTRKDSYPYAAVSPFALHPLYLNIQKLATAFDVEFAPDVYDKAFELNQLPALDYEAVSDLKNKAIREIFEKEKENFKDDFGWIEFFDMNRHWLVPYAVFCCLRDRNGSSDFNTWTELNEFSDEAVQEFASPDKDHYEEVCIHYFIQYHLHLQLTDAVEYAHKKGIIFKGDLPIGIGRYSVDTWMYPELFHMDMQAGAPPDYYSTKGQNWSFPTYNWEAMAADEYKWWRQRMEHLGNYFDAIRIDHVLGFFRIWSIPVASTEGTLGYFQPVIAIDRQKLEQFNIKGDLQRLINPYIEDHILYNLFGDEKDWVSSVFLDGNKFKDQYKEQQSISEFFSNSPQKKIHEEKLMQLLSNRILIKDPENDKFHFRINMHLTSSFQELPEHIKKSLEALYHHYFFEMQNQLWEAEGIKKITALKSTTDMLLCAEDLGMVPHFMEEVLHQLKILSLQVQRMPKDAADNFSHPRDAIYLSVVTPSTHDMSTVRQWWQEEKQHIPYFYNNILAHEGGAPFYCEPWIATEITQQHMHSPAMWAVFLLQDLLGADEDLRAEFPEAERINDPSNPNHDWSYRMHITLDDLLKNENFTSTVKQIIVNSGR